MKGFFVAGTDTGVGKTEVARALCALLDSFPRALDRGRFVCQGYPHGPLTFGLNAVEDFLNHPNRTCFVRQILSSQL